MPFGALTAGLSAAGAGLQANASDKAAKAASAATDKNLAFDNKVYDTATSQLNPTITQGASAGSALAGLLGTGGDPAASDAAFKKYLGSTNYQFMVDQGLKGQAFQSAPNFQSGATAKALGNYNQGMAGTALSGYESLLSGQQALGAQSALGLGGVGTNIAGLTTNANNFSANAAGTAALGGANAFNSAFSNIGQLLGQRQTQSSFGGTSNPTQVGPASAFGAPNPQGVSMAFPSTTPIF